MEADNGAALLRVRVLGEPQLEIDGRAVGFPTGRPGRLLGALLVARGRVLGAGRLIEEVWGDEPPGDPRAALHTTVARVRRALGAHAGALERMPSGYRLVNDAIIIDADEFLAGAAVVAGEDAQATLARLEQALALWRGPAWSFLADDVARGEAMRLEEARLVVREERCAALLEAGAVGDAVGELRVLSDEQPLRERVVALLMTALHRSGDVGAALQAFNEHRTLLADELGLDPASALVELHGEVLRRLPGDAPTGRATPARTPAPSPSPALPRLPSVPSVPALHGRGGHLGTLRQMLELHRCVTVVGPGGVGKTSLAAHAVDPATTWWVDLSSISDPGLVRPAVAEALGVEVFPGSTLDDSLRARLATANGMLVLDNCEHLLLVSAELAAAVLAAGPDVRVVSTSRERLGLTEERVLPLPPLQLPGPDDARPDSPAVALFLERARAVAPDLGDERVLVPLVADLVRRLDGLPLAIELAAGRVGTVTLDDLHDRLGDRLDLLRAATPRAHTRQRTLTSTIEWSYELLEAEERSAFLRLSVFAGPFDLAAAESVLGDQGADLVGRLADRSLLVRPGALGAGEYRMLQTLRAFALSRLDPDEIAVVQRAHAQWVCTLVSNAAEGMRGPGELTWTRLLDRAIADVPLAVGWALANDERELAEVIAAGLHRWGYFRLRPDILRLAVDVLATGGPTATAAVHVTASAYHWMTGELASARSSAERALAGAQDLRTRVAALDALSDCALVSGDLDESAALSEEGLRLSLAEEAWADALPGAVGLALATCYAGGSAEDLVESAHQIASRAGIPSWTAFVHYAEGEVHADTDPDRALAALAEASRMGIELGNRIVSGVAMTAETALRARVAPLDRATVDASRRAVEHWTATGNEGLFVTCLRNHLPLLHRFGAHRPAVELAAATGTSAAFGAEADRLAVVIDDARVALGEEAFGAAEVAGRSRSTNQAGRQLLEELESLLAGYYTREP